MYTRIYEYLDIYVHVHTYVFVFFCIVDIATQTMSNQKKCLNATHRVHSLAKSIANHARRKRRHMDNSPHSLTK